mmetsp:Transcript_3087/g.5837  ORF Transcript_3087/g.5837 Transcript_3087/m.5837 type:complete len:126 (+) Transcript_3087:881-1258(+)
MRPWKDYAHPDVHGNKDKNLHAACALIAFLGIMVAKLGPREKSFYKMLERYQRKGSNPQQRHQVEIKKKILNVVRQGLDSVQFIPSRLRIIYKDIPNGGKDLTVKVIIDCHDHCLYENCMDGRSY